jgi:hypothetical protein
VAVTYVDTSNTLPDQPHTQNNDSFSSKSFPLFIFVVHMLSFEPFAATKNILSDF